MEIMFRKKRIILLFFFILFSICCSINSYKSGVEIYNPDKTNSLLNFMKNLYPEEFKMQHRIILKIRKKQYDFLGYILVKRSTGFRAAAYGEMGGKTFEFLLNNNGSEILFKPDKMPINPLLDGVLNDIKHLYLFDPAEKFKIMNNPNNKISLSYQKDKDSTTEYIFAQDKTDILLKSLEIQKGKIIRVAEYSNYKTYNNFSTPIPSHILLNNYKWKYSIEIDLLGIESVEIDQQIFEKR